MSYDKQILTSIEPSAMIDLVDYLGRKIAYLLSHKLDEQREKEDKEESEKAEKSEKQRMIDDVLHPKPIEVPFNAFRLRRKVKEENRR